MQFKGEVLSLGAAVFRAIATVTVVLGGGLALRAADEDARGPKFAAGEVIVQFKANAAEAHRQDALAHARAQARKHLRTAPMRDKAHPGVVLADTALPVEEAVGKLKQHPAVEFAEPNWIYQHQATANDPYFTSGQLWGVYGPTTQPANAFGAGAAGVWSFGMTGSQSVAVAVIDEGIQWNHPDLAGNIWTNAAERVDGLDNDGNGLVDDVRGWNFYDGNNSVFQQGGDDHGTHVAGTIGARGGNAAGIVGVNWHVTIVPVKFLGFDGGTTLDAIYALDYVTDLKLRHGVDLVAANCSWGGGGYSQALHDAVIRAAKAGILVVAAAGNGDDYGRGINNDTLASYPANYSTTTGTSTESGAGYNAVISVAALNSAGGLASFSNYGQRSVHLAAPGVGIWSTVPVNRYAAYDGTSMATPHVTGSIALYAAARPNDSVNAIRNALLNTTVATPSLGGKTATGGRLSLASLAPSASTNQPPVGAELQAPQVKGNSFTMNLSGGIGQKYQVQVSSNLLDWIPVTTVTNTTGQVQFSDPVTAQWPKKFYRAVSG